MKKEQSPPHQESKPNFIQKGTRKSLTRRSRGPNVRTSTSTMLTWSMRTRWFLLCPRRETSSPSPTTSSTRRRRRRTVYASKPSSTRRYASSDLERHQGRKVQVQSQGSRWRRHCLFHFQFTNQRGSATPRKAKWRQDWKKQTGRWTPRIHPRGKSYRTSDLTQN